MLLRRTFAICLAALVPLLALTILTALKSASLSRSGADRSAMTASRTLQQDVPAIASEDESTAVDEGGAEVVVAALPGAPTFPDLFREPERDPGLFVLPPASVKPLSHFRAALADLKSGMRREPVVVLHIGDSHVASDSFSRGVRSGLQDMFGNAGRGGFVPAGAFKHAAAAGVKATASGSWSAINSMKSKTGPFGLSGIRIVSSSRSAKLSLTTPKAFDWVDVTVATGPREGKVRVTVGDASQVFDAESSSNGASTFRLSERGTTAVISPAGDGQTTVLWHAVGNERPGVRYVNFGLNGATVEVTKRWSDAIVKNDVAAIGPDLVVIGYGTNDGFNDNLGASAFRKRVTHLIDLVRSVSPDTEFLLIGPADGMRRSSRGHSCSVSGWSSAPKLKLVRDVYRDIAEDIHAGYWDWSEVMGGPCGINRWTNVGLAAKDHVHLTSKGYARSASALVDFLVSNSLRDTRVALSN